MAGEMLIIASSHHFGESDQWGTLTQVLLHNGHVETGFDCYSYGAYPGLTPSTPCAAEEAINNLWGLPGAISIAASSDGSNVFVGTRGNLYQLTRAGSDKPQYFLTQNPSFVPQNGIYDPNTPYGAVSAVSPNGEHLYTPYVVNCAWGDFYTWCLDHAVVRVGKPRLANGATNVVPTAMAITSDGSNVYVTYGTPAGPHTKMGGVYVLRPVP
jgi:hypothetical protein